MEGTSHTALLEAAALQAGAFNAAELAALRAKARKSASAVRPAAQSAAAAFDPRLVGRPTDAQLQGLEPLHKNCARKMARALSGLLRASVEAETAAVEQSSGAELLEKLPAAGYLAGWGRALGATALLHLDLALVFPLLDRLLGGTGQEAPEARELTEIEQEIFAPVSGALAQALREAWEPVVKFEAPSAGARPVAPAEAAAFLPPAEQMLALSFEVRLQDIPGRLLLVFPSAIAAALLRRFTPTEDAAPPALPRDSARLRARLLEGRFEAELLLPSSTVSLRQLCGLQLGDVVVLNVRANEPLPVRVAGQEMFLAAPVRCGARRGAQVQQVLSIIPKKEEEERA
jgi:flagellar motor switch protein FliM